MSVVVEWGSSPRWRGKRYARRRTVIRGRLIPALAGKTEIVIALVRSGTAHPRAGGENLPAPSAKSWCAGSSPRWRGKLQSGAYRSLYPGLIPALAGKTSHCLVALMGGPAHPRAGGENWGRAWAGKILGGSSPRWRGKPGDGVGDAGAVRLIPALAGKTRSKSARIPCSWAHPRAGGENWSAPRLAVGQSGSSPRWRGKQRDQGPAECRSGLIPALAGKTSPSTCASLPQRAHPRAGGENISAALHPGRYRGSSPRWRGKQSRQPS